jgi:AraC-like DNA-binding protein
MMEEINDVWEGFVPAPGRRHTSYEGKESLLSELGIVGWLRFAHAFDRALKPDSHSEEYEIHYMVNGEVNWWVEDKNYVLRSGMVLVIQPNEKHGSRTGALEPCEHYWLRIGFPQSQALPGLTEEETETLRLGFEGLTRRAFQASRLVRDSFAKILGEHRRPAKYSSMVCRATLHQLLTAVIRDEERAKSESGSAEISPAIQLCAEAILTNLAHPVTVEKLAKRVGMSETSFRKRFRKEMGSSPLDYMNRKRIEEATRLLSAENAHIKEVAFQLGFSSRQYFATVFKRVTGISPGAFIRNLG